MMRWLLKYGIYSEHKVKIGTILVERTWLHVCSGVYNIKMWAALDNKRVFLNSIEGVGGDSSASPLEQLPPGTECAF
jgi:hypothetical protein